MWPASSQRCSAGAGASRGWRGQRGKENKLGLPGETGGVFVVAFAEELFACQNIWEMWSGGSDVAVRRARLTLADPLSPSAQCLHSLSNLAVGLKSFLLMCSPQRWLCAPGTPKPAADAACPSQGWAYLPLPPYSSLQPSL